MEGMLKFFDQKLKVQLAARGILVGGTMEQDSDMVDLYEDLLSVRAAGGIRPMLYISSCTDLECSLLVLLGEAEGSRFIVPPPKPCKRSRYHFLKG